MSANSPPDLSRSELEYEADQARARLLGTIDALDRRRHELFDWRLQLSKRTGQLALAGGALTFGLACTVGLAVYRARTHDQRVREERWRAIKRSWEHPERDAIRRRRATAVVRSVLLAIVSLTAAGLSGRRVRQARTGGPGSAPVLPIGV